MTEKGPNANTRTEGEMFLELLGLEKRAGELIPGQNGKTLVEFLDICGEHARPWLTGLAALPKDHPDYNLLRNACLEQIKEFLKISEIDQ